MSVSAELQKAIYDTLIADAAVSALIDDRVYDGRPKASNFPCITFGPSDTRADDMECIDGRFETIQLDVWSRDQGKMRRCKEIMDAARNALHFADLSLTVNALVLIRVESMRIFMEGGGLTAHGVITVEADLEQA
ncbi:DUF3168 domain-containing protein [Ruegeria jejuensis]|uniref:DUF3168 domain-containing protein n=1 Tax=Ruegeria jejuensis TaxID=3233338 RepID=UPI00355B2DEC